MKNKGYFGYSRHSDKKMSKKIGIIVAIVAAVFIPAMAALINYAMKANDISLISDNLMKVSLYDGEKLIFEEEENPDRAAANSLVSIFDAVDRNKTNSSKNPDLRDRNELRALITVNNQITEYKCYFSDTEDDSYIIDKNDNVYLIANSDALSFLASEYAETLYPASIPPLLYTTSNEAVTPIAFDWQYRDVSGIMRKASMVKTAEAELMYDMAGAIGISFDTAPDKCSVKIYKSGIIIYSGSYEDLSGITVDPGTTLQFKIDATWNVKDDVNFAGTLTYDFKILLRDRSDFILSNTQLTAGNFILVACTNVMDTNNIHFKAYPDIGFDPIFFEDGDIVRALIPFDRTLKAGSYSLTFSYGAAQETIDVTLLPRLENSDTYSVEENTDDEFRAAVSKEAQQQLEKVINQLDTSYTDYIFFRNAFGNYTLSGGILQYEYGHTFSSYDNKTTHSIQGQLWSFGASSGATVAALNGGRVIYVGDCDYLGNFIVIEHGMGLRTVYAHLSAVTVKLGDYVVRGESIGRTGKLNSYSPEGVFIQCYVFGTAVDYSSIAGQKLEFYSISETK